MQKIFFSFLSVKGGKERGHTMGLKGFCGVRGGDVKIRNRHKI
jgi:hypothetical protein